MTVPPGQRNTAALQQSRADDSAFFRFQWVKRTERRAIALFELSTKPQSVIKLSVVRFCCSIVYLFPSSVSLLILSSINNYSTRPNAISFVLPSDGALAFLTTASAVDRSQIRFKPEKKSVDGGPGPVKRTRRASVFGGCLSLIASTAPPVYIHFRPG